MSIRGKEIVRTLLIILVASLLVLMPVGARADFACSLPSSGDASRTLAPSQELATEKPLTPRVALEQIARPLDAPNGLALPLANAAEFPADEGAAVLTLPPAPSSLVLALTALAGIGAFNAGRSVRMPHLVDLPAWYHADAVQVGHVTPFDIACGAAALTPCVFESPSDLTPRALCRIPREPVSRPCYQFFLLIESPRGPPSCA